MGDSKIKNILYVGGFQLPDKNAAAQRVIGNAKAMREIGYNVIFLNALKTSVHIDHNEKEYEGFTCIEYQRENFIYYLCGMKYVKECIENKAIDIVIAYNYPAIALERIRRYCKKKYIKCYADATEWYVATGNIWFRLIKNIDTTLRMKYVQPKLDGVIAISQYLYNYYCNKTHTVKVPPLVDMKEKKWEVRKKEASKEVKFIYAGSPTSQKERLDIIVQAFSHNTKLVNARLDIVGITIEQYKVMYGKIENYDGIYFHGRISHQKALELVCNSDWSIIIRENNLVVKAGFPMKLVESISAGTPVITNRYSNIDDYLNEDNSLQINNINSMIEISDAIKNACKIQSNVIQDVFDFSKYCKEFRFLLNEREMWKKDDK